MSTYPPNGGLDADELLHLAMKAMEAGNHEGTIGYLKRALAVDREDGRLHYLLGAIHAELGMHDRAIAELSRATELAPHLDTAHFQLGLLYAARGDRDRTVEAWRPLEGPGADPALQLFRTGVLCLTDEDYAGCIDALREGIARNQAYPALSADMHRLLLQAEEALAAGAGSHEPRRAALQAASAGAPTDEAQHVLLNRYQSGDGGR